MISVDVTFSARCVDEEKIKDSVVVVIDVLRATSVMIKAFENGIKEIIPVLTPEEAFAVKRTLNGDVILGGERNAEKIPGFDLDNSPLSYENEIVNGSTLVMTTTNGTAAIRGAENASEVLIGAFLNAGAVVGELQGKKKVNFVCAGTNGNYTLEDGLCAGYMIDMMMKKSELSMSDSAVLIHSFYLQSNGDVRKAASLSYHYRVLEEKGFGKDLKVCFRMNESNIVPFYSNGKIKNR